MEYNVSLERDELSYMNIIILGAGAVGFGLAEHLSHHGHHVNIIECNEQLCEQINHKLDVSAIAGIGSSPKALEDADIKSADMIIAVTPSDEINLLACNFAMQNGVKKRIARVKSDLYTADGACIDLKELGVTHVIEPEREMVEKIIQFVELPGVIETANFQSGNVYLRGYQITEDMPIANKTLAEIKTIAKSSPILFMVIMRNGKSISPTGRQKLLPGDKVVAIMPKESFKTFLSLLNRKPTKLKKIVVAGDSLTAIHLADALKPLSEAVYLLDPCQEHGKIAASMLHGVEVLYGDSTDSEVLQDIYIGHADYFVAAGKDTADNIMSCALAKKEGAKKVIAVRNNERYSDFFESMGIDYLITPQQITINAIIEMIQIVHLGTYLKLKTTDMEVMRLKAQERSLAVGKTLRELDAFSEKSVIVGCILRDSSIIIPDGNTAIESKDEAIVLCKKESKDLASKYFGS